MHVWGAASGAGKPQLVIIEGNLDAARYQDILREKIADMRARGVMHDNSIFEDDHARPHTAILNQTWKVENLGDGLFCTSARYQDHRLYAPSKMDDFCFIERLWRELSTRVHRKPIPQNAEQFREKIKEGDDFD